MGLKTVGFGPWSSGKSFFGLSLAELGPIGVVDTEDRMEWYTDPLPMPTPARAFPFDRPRRIRPALAPLAAATGIVYLVQTKEISAVGRAIEAWTADPDIVGVSLDSGSIVWDLLQDTRDESDPRTAMLSWVPVKKTNRRLMYAAMSGGKHLFISAHAQARYKKVGKELVVDGEVPWLEKKSPHLVDLVLQFIFPDGMPHPIVRVEAEKVGGQGGLRRGAILGDPAKGDGPVTFGGLLRRLSYVPEQTPGLAPDEVEYRNQTTVARVGGSPAIAEVDGEGR